MTIACDAVLNAASAYKKQDPESWEEEIQVSRHARSLRQLDNGVRIPPRYKRHRDTVIELFIMYAKVKTFWTGSKPLQRQ